MFEAIELEETYILRSFEKTCSIRTFSRQAGRIALNYLNREGKAAMDVHLGEARMNWSASRTWETSPLQQERDRPHPRSKFLLNTTNATIIRILPR